MDKLKTDVGLVQDIRGLDKLRQLGTSHDEASQQAALEAAARQFESIFNQMWVSSMRQTNDELAADSPLNSRYSKFFQGMLDEQMTASMGSAGGDNSLAKMIVKQLSPKTNTHAGTASADQLQMPGTPRRQLQMPDERLPVMRRFARWEGQDSADGSVKKTVGTDDASTGLGATTQATANTPVPAGVAAAERFVTRMDQMQRNFKRVATRISGAAFGSPEEFVRQLLPAAEEVAKRVGLSPVALLAQAALETGWGRKMMKNSDGSNGNNLFGIKAGQRWQGASTKVASLEYEQGQPVMRQSAFRSYNSFVQSMEDYVSLIGNDSRYSKARAVAQDPDAYFEALQQAGYATDPQYANKLKQVIRSDAFAGVWQSAEL